MSQVESIVDIEWKGPYGWPGFETDSNLLPLPKQSGHFVYLQTVEYHNGYLIYLAGLTRRTVPQRFYEHTRKYMSGDYTVLDIAMMQRGVRREIWHGWGWSPEKHLEFERRKEVIVEAVRKQLTGFRIFVADVGIEPRIPERLEAAIMNSLYQQQSPYCYIPDTGMMLSPRWASEHPITVKNKRQATIYGLPNCLEI